MTRRTLLALPLAQPIAATAPPPLSPLEESKLAILLLTFEERATLCRWWFGANSGPPLSLEELKAAFLALPLNDRITFALWADNARRVLSGTDDHSQWLADHSKAIAEIRELQRSTDERIEKLVSKISKIRRASRIMRENRRS